MMQTATVSQQEPQRQAALARANQIRLARAQLKRRIAGGDISAAHLILDSPLEASSWAVWDVLISQRRWGTTKCRKFLSSNGISETKQLGQLTERQRRVLADQLQAQASREREMQLV